jgi:hypothetical protein
MYGVGLVHLDGNLLPTGQQIVLVESVGVLDLLQMRAGDELHAAGHLVGRRHRDPGGRDVGRGEAPIGRVLVPGDEAGILRLLDEETGVPAQDIGPQHILDRIEDFGVADHLVDPGKQYVAAMAHLAPDRAATLGLVCLELVAKVSDLAWRERIDRKVVAIATIRGDLRLVQHLGHVFLPDSCS